MHIGPLEIPFTEVLVLINGLSTCVIGWLGWRAERRTGVAEARAEHWERVARGVAARAKLDQSELTKATVVAPAWHAPRTATPGQRLAHLVHTARDFRVSEDD